MYAIRSYYEAPKVQSPSTTKGRSPHTRCRMFRLLSLAARPHPGRPIGAQPCAPRRASQKLCEQSPTGGPAARQRGVITSYSIHYTKLYEAEILISNEN